MLQLDDFYKARFVLSQVIRKTELVHTPRINPDSDVYLKPECLQKTGSFKIRGAYYKISQLSQRKRRRRGDCLFGRQPCTGCGSRSYRHGSEEPHLSARGCPYLQGRGYQAIWVQRSAWFRASMMMLTRRRCS